MKPTLKGGRSDTSEVEPTAHPLGNIGVSLCLQHLILSVCLFDKMLYFMNFQMFFSVQTSQDACSIFLFLKTRDFIDNFSFLNFVPSPKLSGEIGQSKSVKLQDFKKLGDSTIPKFNPGMRMMHFLFSNERKSGETTGKNFYILIILLIPYTFNFNNNNV